MTIQWCVKHNGRVLVKGENCEIYESSHCEVVPRLLVDPDAPSILYRGGFLDIDPADRQATGLYVKVAEYDGPAWNGEDYREA